MVLQDMELNQFDVTGTLKSMDLTSTTQDGDGLIRGNVTVEVVDGEKINNLTFNIYTRETTKKNKPNKFFAGLRTAMSEYKTIDNVGKEDADVIRISGDDGYNIYKSQNGNVRENNRFRATYMTRTNKDATQSAVLNIKAAILGFEEETNEQGESTGLTKVDAINVGYNGRVNKLVGLKVKTDLGMENYFVPGQVADLSIVLENYATVEVQESDEQAGGFGNYVSVVNTTSYTNDLLILGGAPTEDESFESEQLEEVRKELANMKAEAIERADSRESNAQPKKQSGFGTKSNNPFDNTDIQIKNSDVPF